MRQIYIRFKDFSNFRTRTFEERSVTYGCIVNSSGQQLCLDRPTLYRKIVGGVFIEDHGGYMTRWFQDNDSSTYPVWGVV